MFAASSGCGSETAVSGYRDNAIQVLGWTIIGGYAVALLFLEYQDVQIEKKESI
jgi:hypothetical protein